MSTIAPPRRARFVAGALLITLLAVAASLALGSKSIALGEVWQLLWQPAETHNSVVIHDLRIPRTVLGLLVGAALGVAGAQMQSLTRNPLGDPGILGVNAGAAFAVVLAVAATGISSISFYLWFGFAGAAGAVAAVYLLGSLGAATATPARLALAGVAISAALGAITQVIILGDQHTFNEFRFWAAGSLEGRGWDIAQVVGPLIGVGLITALLLAPSLNALALGEETAAGLGVNVRRTRALTMGCVALLSGCATAAVGPVGFIGLGIPFIARALLGPDQRWVVPASAVLGGAGLLLADVLGRVLTGTDEVQVGIVTALLGGPVFIAIVRQRRIAAL